MKENMQFTIQDLHFISVVVPSVNGNYAKLLMLDKNEIKKDVKEQKVLPGGISLVDVDDIK